MSQEEENKNINQLTKGDSDFANTAKDISSNLLAFIGIAYACGFFITNIHLSTYQIYDFSIVNTRFTYTGFVFLLFCFMAFFFAIVLERIISESKQEEVRKVKFARIVIALFGWAVISSFLSLFFKSILSFVDGPISYFRFPITGWFNIAIFLFGIRIYTLNKASQKDRFPLNSSLSILSSSFTSLIVLAALYASAYYPLLPVSLAGGRPVAIQLVFEDDKIPLVAQMVKMEKDNVSETVYLIEQGPDAYYILAQSDRKLGSYHPVEINKSLVEGVLHPVEVNAASFIH